MVRVYYLMAWDVGALALTDLQSDLSLSMFTAMSCGSSWATRRLLKEKKTTPNYTLWCMNQFIYLRRFNSVMPELRQSCSILPGDYSGARRA